MQEADNNRRSRGRAVLSILFASVGFVVLRFLLTPVRIKMLTALLTLEQYGTITLISVSISFIALVSSLGSLEFLFRFLPGRTREYQFGVLKRILVCFGGGAILLAVIGVVALNILKPAKLDLDAWGVAACGVLLVLTIHVVHRVYFLFAETSYSRGRITQLLYADAWFIPLVLFASAVPWSTTGALWVWVLWLAGTIILTWKWVPLEKVFRVPVPAGTLRAILAFGLPTMPMVLGEWLFRVIGHYALLWFEDIASVAVYGLAVNLAMVGYVVGTSILDVLITEFNKIRNGLTGVPAGSLVTHEPLRKIFTVMIRYTITVAIPVIAALCLLEKPLVLLLSNERFTDAARIMPWTSPMPLLFLIDLIFGKVLLSMNRSRIVGIASLSSAVLMAVLSVFLVPALGGRGAALSGNISLLALVLFLGWKVRCWRWIVPRELMPFRMAGLLLVCCCGFIAVRHYLAFNSLAMLGAGALLYVAAAFVLGLVRPSNLSPILESAVVGTEEIVNG